MYQDETYPPILNKLTEQLYAEGWTRDKHPDYVCWDDFQNLGYKWEYALKLTWETSCGLLVKGDSRFGRDFACGDTTYDGVWYCAENDNPILTCQINKKDCLHRIAGISFIWCPCHQTLKPYDYENSVEKIDQKQAETEHAKWLEKIKCRMDCVNCDNAQCLMRKESLTPPEPKNYNVFYDIRRTWITRKGLFEEKRVEMTKGVKVLEHPVTKRAAERWLRANEKDNTLFHPKMIEGDRKMQYFSKMHRLWPGYDYFEFHYEVENIRVDKTRVKRDLLQDLRDAQEGIKVIHESDRAKAAKEVKSERLKKAREKRKQPKSIVKKIRDTAGQEKIDKAKELLRTTDMDYNEIAEEVGISTKYARIISELPDESKMESLEQLSLF